MLVQKFDKIIEQGEWFAQIIVLKLTKVSLMVDKSIQETGKHNISFVVIKTLNQQEGYV